MKCPYATTLQTFTQETYKYNEDGQITSVYNLKNEVPKFLNCLESKCGAWRHGHCNYKG